MVRGAYYDKNGVKRGAWSKEEDHRLTTYIQTYGHSNWRQLPKFAGLSRCGKSCRLRWLNYLRPNLKRGNYTREEEHIIIKLHQQHGNKWSLIAGKLPGRTDNEVKNYWHSNLKKRSKFNHENEMTSCEFKMKARHDSICEGETSENREFEKSFLSNQALEPSCNIKEGSSEECDSELAAWEIFDELNKFWTEPFVTDEKDTYGQQDNLLSLNYATNEVDDMDQYLSHLFGNEEFLYCQAMEELPY